MSAKNQASFSSKDSFGAAAEKPPMILVYGAFRDGFIWIHVTAGLQAMEPEVLTIDLPAVRHPR